ncbi:glycosyl transferase [Alicyclobacillus contaminans]|uniref:hypothetical protein n=1 Tax=Alicyclobacillus contaminans TaxID=392016 RepID=UPI0003FFED65|nr:hypothetical protein [Alicyclobacillus contaminans]GMA50548.1 glycosyl transferase [Alicyclobacillus contaminans]
MTSEENVCGIIAVQNETSSLKNVLRQLHRAGVTTCVVVVNHIEPAAALNAAEETAAALAMRLHEVSFEHGLGPDIGRSVGTYAALRTFPNAKRLLYVDGDWMGSFGPALAEFLKEGRDDALDCLWVAHSGDPRPDIALWQDTLHHQHPHLTDVAPNELPLLVDRAVFEWVSPRWLAHPGRWLALLAAHRRPPLRLGVSRAWSARYAGNPVKSGHHQAAMRATLLGDALDGCRLMLCQRPGRTWRGRLWNGYHTARRFDALDAFAGSITIHLPP